VRSPLVAFGLFVAALTFVAAPAYAHADHTGDAAVGQAEGAPDHLPHGGAPRHDSDHNSADHSHPIGEDPYHEKASHSSLDVAHFHSVTVSLAVLPRAANLPAVNEAARGRVFAPPIRPPLG
jgi:hypothetical protein